MLLERQTFLGQLGLHLADAVGGRGRIVFVAGEAGIGKTSLVRTFTAGLGEGVRVLWGACEDLSTPEALGPLRDLARDASWSLPQSFDAESSRLAVFSEAIGVLGATPTVAVIEDLHWADDATMDFVRYLGRRISGRPVLLLVTSRDEDVSGVTRLRRALVDLPPEARTRMDLPRLSPEVVRDLARERAFDAADLFAATGGNPFYVAEMLAGGGQGAPPPTVRDAVLARSDRLSARARAVLDAACVFPRRVEAGVLRAVCGADTDEGVEECVAAGMLLADGDGYAFRHEIARRAAEAALSGARRRALNARALAALGVDPAVSLARLVHHADQAGDDRAVLDHAPKAAQQAAALGAHQEAARHYAAALRHAAGLDDDARARLHELHAFEAHLIGDLAEAVASQEAALALRRRNGQTLLEGDGLRWLSRLSYLTGDRLTADRYAAEAMRLLETAPPGAELAMAYSNLSQLAMLSDDTAQAVRWGGKAIALAEQLERPDILSHALNNVGASKVWVDAASARADLERSLKLALLHDQQDHVARTYVNFACLEINLRAHATAHRLLEAGIAYCVERDLDTWRNYLRGWLAETYLREGRCDAAAEAALLVVQNDRASPVMRNPAVVALARLRMRRGDPEVTPLLDEVARFMAKGVEAPRLASYAILAAERAWITGSGADAALALLDQARAMRIEGADPWQAGEIWFWRRKLGAPVDRAAAGGMAPPYLELLNGDWRAAADRWEALKMPYETALALLEGDDEAQRQGIERLDGWGAAASATRARQDLRQLGLRNIPRGPRASTRANPAGLTRRQMDVLDLLDQGLSNGEIAGKLYVSAKTVDHHVSAILAKLEAGSRGEAAAIARRAGLIGLKG
ncbi:MAG TPA: AAA family ATPase [Phenylobacterium sp.]|nr:AAA family ATPase [Phenylobacterium sp.]